MKNKLSIILLAILMPFIAISQNKNGKYIKLADFPQGKPMPYKGVSIGFNFNVLVLNYDKYLPLIGYYNDSINTQSGTVGLELGYIVNDHCLGLSYGYFDMGYETDSLKIKFSNRLYEIKYGFNLINTWQFTVRPTIAIKWNRSRLLNYANDKNTTLEEYMDDRDLNLRFNQPLGYIGVQADYKIYEDNLSTFWTFGLYAGNVFKLVPGPLVYSRNTRLSHTPPLGLKSISGGIYLICNIDFYN